MTVNPRPLYLYHYRGLQKIRKKRLTNYKIVEGIILLEQGGTFYFICPGCNRKKVCKILEINEKKILELKCKKCRFEKHIPMDLI